MKILEKEVGLPEVEIEANNSTPDWSAILNQATVTAEELQEMKIQPREFLLQPFFKVGDFGILYAQRGVGKTWLGYLIARGVSQGTSVGLWTCPKACPVLLVDGEMPLDLTKERDKQFATGDANLFFLHHQVLYDRTEAELNLTSPLIQDALENLCVERKIALLILDNQSTLLAGVSETDPDAWNLIQPFLLRLQRRGIAVLLVVHAGRNNQARGHSRREDRTSWMISLTDRKEDESEGAKFISEFAKPSRVCPLLDMRHGNKVWIEKRWMDGSIVGICGEIIRIATRLETNLGLRAEEISIDGSGDYGKQVGDELAKMGWHVNRFYGQSKDVNDQDYLNRISEAWIGGCATIKNCDIIIPDDDNFRAQCLSRKQRTGAGGKLQVEPKDEYMKRGFESCHEGDAVFGAMLPIHGSQCVNMAGFRNDEPDDRGWVERAYDEQVENDTGLPSASCL